MSEAKIENSENKLGILNLLVIILSIYVLGSLLVDSFVVLSPETSTLLII